MDLEFVGVFEFAQAIAKGDVLPAFQGGDRGDPSGFFSINDEFGVGGDERLVESESDEVFVCFSGTLHAGDDFLPGVASLGVGNGSFFESGVGWKEAGEKFVRPLGDAIENAAGLIWAQSICGVFFALVDEFHVVGDEVFVEARHEFGREFVGAFDNEVVALFVDLHEEFELAFGVEEAGVDHFLFARELDVVGELAVEIAFGIGSRDANAAAGFFDRFVEVGVESVVLAGGCGKVFRGIAHLRFEEIVPGNLVGIGGNSGGIGELQSVEGVLGHVLGGEMRGKIAFEKRWDLHPHDGGIATVQLGRLVPVAGIDSMPAGDFERLGERLHCGSRGEVGRDLDDRGSGRGSHEEDFL